MAEKLVTMVMSVPETVVFQSKVAVRMCEKSKGILPVGNLLHAKKSVDGLLPLPEDIYAPKPIKANEAQMTPAMRAELAADVVTYGDAQAFVRERNRAEKAVQELIPRRKYTAEALAEIHAEIKAAKSA